MRLPQLGHASASPTNMHPHLGHAGSPLNPTTAYSISVAAFEGVLLLLDCNARYHTFRALIAEVQSRIAYATDAVETISNAFPEQS